MRSTRTTVTLATRIYFPEPAAASFRLAAVVRGLAEAGADVLILTTTPRGGATGKADVSAVVRRWPALRDRAGYVRGYLQYLSFDLPLTLRLLLSRRADVVLVEPPPTSGAVVRVVCALRRIPYVYFAPDIWSDATVSLRGGRLVSRILRAVEAWAASGAVRVLAVNDDLADRMRRLAPGTAVETVGNGVDTRVFTPDGTVASTERYALYVGTTSEWQGADVFVRAMSIVVEQVPDARLIFVGQGSAWEELHELVRERGLGDAVRFVDTVPAERAAEWIRGAKVTLVSMKPGQGYDFAFPTKVAASLASGVPVIYAGVGPARDFVGSAPADIIAGAVADHDELPVAEHIVRFLLRPREADRRTRLAEWARERVSLDSVARRAAIAVLDSAADPARPH